MDREEFESTEKIRLYRLGETLAAAAEEVFGVVRDELTDNDCRDELQKIVDELQSAATDFYKRSQDVALNPDTDIPNVYDWNR